MHEKKPLLNIIGRELNLNVTGIENYTINSPSLIVANHTCIKDIFAVPAALPEACQIVLSARLMWKRNNFENYLRRLTIEESLYGIPLEVHGGDKRLRVGMEMAKKALMDGWPVVIFPEGAYTNDHQVTRGRTGASQILFEARQAGLKANLIPISIDNQPAAIDLDDFMPNGSSININISKPIDYDEFYARYQNTDNFDEKRQALHAPIDIAMKSIARIIKQPYVDSYIKLNPRSTIVLESGEEISL